MKLKVNWPYLISCIVLWFAVCVFIGWVVTAATLGRARLGLPNPGGWPLVIVLDLACFAAFLWGVWKIYCDVNTLITDEYVSQPSVNGIRKIAWAEATKITTYGSGITVHGQDSKIVLTPYAYTKPDEVSDKVAQIAERHSLQIT